MYISHQVPSCAPWFVPFITRSREEEIDRSMENVQLDQACQELRQTFAGSRTKSAQWRRSQLRALLRLIQEKEDEMYKALMKDLGKPRVEAFRDEVGVLNKSLNLALGSLDKWMAPKSVGVPLVAFPTTAQLVPEPLGVVLIFSSWNFPMGLALDPLVGAIAAGNAVAIKPSELAPASSAFLAKTIPLYLDTSAIKVFEGGADVGEHLLSKKWDHIFFTGSHKVGSLVMSAAAKHLTPVTLEMGGKCPAILDSLTCRREREIAMGRIVNAKWGVCGGQVCLGVDYLLVEESAAASWIELMKEKMRDYYGDDPRTTGIISKIVNKRHFDRLKNLLQDPAVAATIIHGGKIHRANNPLESTPRIRDHVRRNLWPPAPNNHSKPQQQRKNCEPPFVIQEINEPVKLNFSSSAFTLQLKDIEQSVEFINSLPKPLAVYAFTKDRKLKEKILAETSSGCVTFDDAIIQFLFDTLPFGGVGRSGFGRYHGKYTFDAFSHEKAVLRRHYLFEFRFGYPPWGETKLKLLRAVYEYDYLNLVLLLLGLKR
ncbi:hypothetical protein Taro_041238 [Colocasia esculenta]|uniref:Aldehyde dehydrogenase n=1 Tax=Colocasia esculenta TaxID=4460 RepID=A0A843WAZ4_COLES|nr:hypothetical protein [Colocasia esculenta]